MMTEFAIIDPSKTRELSNFKKPEKNEENKLTTNANVWQSFNGSLKIWKICQDLYRKELERDWRPSFQHKFV